MTRRPPRSHGLDSGTTLEPAVRRSVLRRPAPEHWPALPCERWRAALDTLHAHTQVLGKLSAALVVDISDPVDVETLGAGARVRV